MKSQHVARDCNCGSGLPSAWTYDARGIELARVCDRCRDRVLAGYRPDVFDDPDYEIDEPLEDGDDLGYLFGADDLDD